jgi:hypothetical protein
MSTIQHGTRHKPRGSDPSECDVFIVVGEDPRVPYVNGFPFAATADIPNPTPLQFRLSVGPPNVCSYDGWEPADPTSPPDPATSPRPVASAVLQYTDHQIEIQGDVDGVSPGDIVFVIPVEYRKATDLPCHAHDSSGNYVACRLLSTGEFIYGVP